MTRFEASAHPRRQPWPGPARSGREAVVSTDAARGARRDTGGMTSGAQTRREPPADSVFARVVVGVDGTDPSYEACRQAARLLDPGGSLELVAVVHLAGTVHAGFAAPRHAARLEHEAREALLTAAEIAGPTASAELVNGRAAESLLRRLEEQQATLVAIGTHGHSRASEILLGGVAGELLHAAPCSVLVARPRRERGPRFPVGSSPASTARPKRRPRSTRRQALAARLGVPLRVVTALGRQGRRPRPGAGAGAASASSSTRTRRTRSSGGARRRDLLVVGSRGAARLAGARQRVGARRARARPRSVLVVRPPAA